MRDHRSSFALCYWYLGKSSGQTGFRSTHNSENNTNQPKLTPFLSSTHQVENFIIFATYHILPYSRIKGFRLPFSRPGTYWQVTEKKHFKILENTNGPSLLFLGSYDSLSWLRMNRSDQTSEVRLSIVYLSFNFNVMY